MNLDAAESRTAPRSLDDLGRLGVPLKPTVRPTTSSFQPMQRRHQIELEARQKLWPWLLLGAAGVMIGEIVLAGWVTRRRATPTQASA